MPFEADHFIDTQMHQSGEIQRGAGFVHMLEKHAPEPGVVLAQNTAGLLHRQLAPQRQGQGREIAREMFTFAG